MAEAIRSVILAGRGLLRWPGGEERVNYRVTVALDNRSAAYILARLRRRFCVGPAGTVAFSCTCRKAGGSRSMLRRMVIYRRMVRWSEAWMGKTGGWNTAPWLPFETPDRFTLAIKAGSIQIFESHPRHRNRPKLLFTFGRTWKWRRYGRHLVDRRG